MISFITPIYGDRGISRINDLIYNVSLYLGDGNYDVESLKKAEEDLRDQFDR